MARHKILVEVFPSIQAGRSDRHIEILSSMLLGNASQDWTLAPGERLIPSSSNP